MEMNQETNVESHNYVHLANCLVELLTLDSIVGLKTIIYMLRLKQVLEKVWVQLFLFLTGCLNN
jgi:hypothetical protein